MEKTKRIMLIDLKGKRFHLDVPLNAIFQDEMDLKETK